MSDTMITGHHARAIQRAPVRRGGWTPSRRKLFLDTLAATCNVKLAAAATGLTASSAYQLRKRDAGFAELWREALACGYDALETALLEHALVGVNAITVEPLAIDPLADRATVLAAAAAKDDAGDGGGADGDDGGRAGDGTGDAAAHAADDEGAASPRRGGGRPSPTGLQPAEVTRLVFALRLLDRHRAEVQGEGRPIRGHRVGTAEQTDTLLRQKLDRIARRLALKRAAAGATPADPVSGGAGGGGAAA